MMDCVARSKRRATEFCSAPRPDIPPPVWKRWPAACGPRGERKRPRKCKLRLGGKWCGARIAVDTNVLVHLLTDDDPRQGAAARSLFAKEAVWIAKTVLFETGWVLRSLYGFEESAIREAFTKLLGLPKVRTEDEASVVAALALTAHGIEFADAMDLGSRPVDALCLRRLREPLSHRFEIERGSKKPRKLTPAEGTAVRRRAYRLFRYSAARGGFFQ